MTTITDLTVTTIAGEAQALADYVGKVLLIVNVASYCGYTSQYRGLENLYQKYKDQGFEILAFPCNDFGAQEPGSNEEIAQFCETQYGISFPIFDKLHAKGPQQAPLYARLIEFGPEAGEAVGWNFEKFLINKQGDVIGRYKSSVTPDSGQLQEAIEQALAR